jgi:hypothetical protein
MRILGKLKCPGGKAEEDQGSLTAARCKRVTAVGARSTSTLHSKTTCGNSTTILAKASLNASVAIKSGPEITHISGVHSKSSNKSAEVRKSLISTRVNIISSFTLKA